MDYSWMKMVETKLDLILSKLDLEDNSEQDYGDDLDEEEKIKGELEAELDEEDDNLEDIDELPNPEKVKQERIKELKKVKMPPRTADFEDEGLPSLDDLDD